MKISCNSWPRQMGPLQQEATALTFTKRNGSIRFLSTLAKTLLLVTIASACQTLNPQIAPSQGHINTPDETHTAQANIPTPVKIAASLPKPQPLEKEPTHTVVVHQVPVSELLFSLARDADLNLDIDSDVVGLVTLNAIDQPMHALLDRIAESVNLSYEVKNNVLRVKRDRPILRNYRIDYINMSRTSESSSSVSTQISSTGQSAGEAATAGNNSETAVTNKTESVFWQTLEKNIAAIIYQEPEPSVQAEPATSRIPDLGPALGQPSSAEPATVEAPQAEAQTTDVNQNIIINKESGIIGVRTTKAKHREVERFISEIMFSTRRQVLIEATIAEVQLSDSYQAGIDWSLLEAKIDETISVGQTITDIALFDRPSFFYQITRTQGDGDTIQSTLSALETFGDVKIMSSPKVMALNNQTALLKVVDNIVYFSIEVNIEVGDDDDGDSEAVVTYETEINTVPVGFVMSVTPYINENDSVTLSVRPTISRVISQARDPNPALAEVGVISEVPVIQVREVESVLKIDSGNTAIMGGLMQDEITNTNEGVPVLSRIPVLGSLFRYESDKTQKTELVIFIRPQVVKHASLEGDLSRFKKYLPNSDY